MTTILDTQKKSKKDKNALIVGTELVQILTEINRLKDYFEPAFVNFG